MPLTELDKEMAERAYEDLQARLHDPEACALCGGWLSGGVIRPVQVRPIGSSAVRRVHEACYQQEMADQQE